jgi:hypothetical protein
VPKRLELIILKALKKNRSERYGGIEEMLHDLDTVDIDEKAERPTTSFARHKKAAVQNPDGTLVEKRITDRRSGDRRHRISAERNVFAPAFWARVWETQQVALVLIALLALILALHLIMHH